MPFALARAEPMSFQSFEYAIFFVVVFLVFWTLHRFGVAKIAFLLIASWFFYGAGKPEFLLILLASTFVDYTCAIEMEDAKTPAGRKRWLMVSIITNLSLLGFFKYANFFQETVVYLVDAFGASWHFDKWDIVLPAGISFYTFMTLSYTVDVYRRQIPVERDFIRFAFFIGFFAHLIAGPIVRAKDLIPQIGQKSWLSRQQASRALWLIAVGIVKKGLVADALGRGVVDKVFGSPDVLSSADILVGLYTYTIQIYLDFSAYSDMAIGSALLLGYHLPDNFDRPYQSKSISEFWRRWHMTMSSFLRDYVYFPLGGARGTNFQVYRNLFVTFFLIGLWHGASWNFALYGTGHAFAMITHRWIRKRKEARGVPDKPGSEKLDAFGVFWRVFVTFHFVVLMRILFRSATQDGVTLSSADALAKAGAVTRQLFAGEWSAITVMTPWLWALLIGAYVVHWTPRRWVEATWVGFRKLPFVAQGAIMISIVLFASALADGKPPAFEYFQF